MAAGEGMGRGGLVSWLFREPYSFHFFQAVRLLGQLHPDRQPVGYQTTPAGDLVRFRARLSLAFPPSEIFDLGWVPAALDYETVPLAEPHPASPDLSTLSMTVCFLGLTGPKGVLPLSYTDILLRLDEAREGEQEGDVLEKNALRAWLDLLNHRLISLFYRAWEKYRFYLAYERKKHLDPDADPFTQALFSLFGLGTGGLRGRLRVEASIPSGMPGPAPLASVEDLALLSYAGFLAQRHRCAASLQALLADYFQVPVRVEQFRGQWLYLDEARQSSLEQGGNNQLGISAVAGTSVWDAQSKFRVRLGPLRLHEFTEFLPDREPRICRKSFFLLCHLVRLYVGVELDFDIQLVLFAPDVPDCKLVNEYSTFPRLGWNTWLGSRPMKGDAEDVVFEAEEVVFLDRA